ncbi:hypothetical protein BDR05DRAFT_991050 [Suillus weaverae]|nr:hypothetical protein BDR05DRAFT_991050 [Suillus weaverae]
MPLRDDHVAALVLWTSYLNRGKKRCWCCDRLLFELLVANEARFKFPGSNGVIYPWSPRVGVNVKVLQRLEYALFQQLREAIDKGRNPKFGLCLSQRLDDVSSHFYGGRTCLHVHNPYQSGHNSHVDEVYLSDKSTGWR